MTFFDLIRQSGSEAPKGVRTLDVELLLMHVTGYSRARLLARGGDTVKADQLSVFYQLWTDRCRLVPLAYLTGTKEFFGRDFFVDSSVLIPRPDTELLVELAITLDLPVNASVLELGTGSGVVAVSLALERPTWTITASDISHDALRVARRNAACHEVLDRVSLLHSDWFGEIPPVEYDLILSNPPYVCGDDPALDLASRLYEPALALCAKEGGLAACRAILAQAQYYSHPNTRLMLEHGYDQAESVVALARGLGYSLVAHKADLAGISRVVIFAV